MTEEEAKNKICPIITTDDVNCESYTKCLASKCMAWRFHRSTSNSEITISLKDGYCGLVGNP